MTIDIVLQGPIYPYTVEIINHYLALPINKIIVSCWVKDNFSYNHPRVEVIQNDITKVCPGTGNVNYQIKTSKAGILQSSADLAFKVRTDQQIHNEDMMKLVEFFNKNYATLTLKLDGTLPKGRILCTSIFTEFPYHPRDHLYLGYREDMVTLLDIPFSNQPNYFPDFTKGIRAEAFIGVTYFAKFSNISDEHLKQPESYIVDGAPYIQEAFKESERLRDQLFLVSPKVRHIWKKYHIMSYRYLESPSYKEYWSDKW